MNLSDFTRNANMLRGSLARKGYMRWWHSFSGVNVRSGETRTFFVEFIVLNPQLYTSGRNRSAESIEVDQPILGQHPYYRKRKIKPSYVCIKAGVFPDASGGGGKELQAYYPVCNLKVASNPFIMEIGDCFYSEDHMQGNVEVSYGEARHRSLMTDSGSMEWDLQVHKAVSCHTGLLAGRFFQLVNALDTYWHGEGIKTFFRGSVTLDGECYEVSPETSYGYCDKHWGKSFQKPHLQLASGNLTSNRTGRALKHSALAIDGCCPRFLFFKLKRRLLIQLTYTGEDFCFGLQPDLFARCKWETKETDKRFVWHIVAQNRTAVIKISGSCTKEQMMQLRYENPEGLVYRSPLLASGCGIGNIEIYRRRGRERVLLDKLHMDNCFCEYRVE